MRLLVFSPLSLTPSRVRLTGLEKKAPFRLPNFAFPRDAKAIDPVFFPCLNPNGPRPF